MSNRRHHVLSSTILLVTLAGCGSVVFKSEYKKLADPRYSICSGKQASKKYVFTISYHVKVPKGLLVTEVQPFLDQKSSMRDLISSKIVDYFLDNYLVVTSKEVLWKHNPNVKMQVPDGVLFPENFVRTGAFNFISCHESHCDCLIDPVNGERVQALAYGPGQAGLRGWNPLGPKPCTWFYSEATQDSEPAQHDGCARSIFDPGRFIRDTGFNPGAYMGDKYLQVSEREQGSVCKLAGMSEGCFKLPENPDQLETFRGELRAREMNATDALFGEYFSGKSFTDHGLRERFKELKQDLLTQIRIRSALTFEIALQSSKRISKKVQGNWVMHRIEWDPTLFCKYAKPTNDLYTY